MGVGRGGLKNQIKGGENGTLASGDGEKDGEMIKQDKTILSLLLLTTLASTHEHKHTHTCTLMGMHTLREENAFVIHNNLKKMGGECVLACQWGLSGGTITVDNYRGKEQRNKS